MHTFLLSFSSDFQSKQHAIHILYPNQKDKKQKTFKMHGMVATKKLFKGRKMSQAKAEAKGFEQVQLPTKSLAALDLPPPPKPVEVIEEEEPVKKERVEKIISDWVSEL